MTFQVAVCGPRYCTDEDKANARKVGELLADAGAVVICGGGIGVMEAVASGVKARGGIVIGIRPGNSREGASPDLTATIVTNMGEARNAIIVWSADAVISVGGSWGTLSEIALAKRRGNIPVVCLAGWSLVDKDGASVPGLHSVDTPQEAVDMVLSSQTDSVPGA
ncbi:hypothetical protein EV385_4532 [Krasilnikovia cinnamomea]|uniref:TIGR00725 family protein n=1 Tax=Krasilnikovia cinnamomea TaxID=349313 RepID=A0A4Q7ZNN7_9ACTN|nr:TIGR00725 family protein [Krasilnikovia cinnamomea]RZU52657.1 hypothetical protein EV385_4532 [Krasilnikovia cinnamomea]